MCAPCDAKNATLFFLNMMLFAMLILVSCAQFFLCLFLNMFKCSTLLNNVKVETDEIYFIVSF